MYRVREHIGGAVGATKKCGTHVFNIIKINGQNWARGMAFVASINAINHKALIALRRIKFAAATNVCAPYIFVS